MSLIPADTVVVVETKWFPPLRVPLTDSGASKPSIFLEALKPKVTLTVQGRAITSAAPAGEPVPNQWPKVKIGLAVAAGLLVFSLLRVIR